MQRWQKETADQPLTPSEEKALVENARREPEAFTELYRQYVARIYAYVAYRVRSSDDGEDIIADTFLKALERIDQFTWQGDGSFAAWLFRIAHNSIQDYYRLKGRSNGAVSMEDMPDVFAGPSVPEDALTQKEQFELLSRLIARLSPRRQEVITLRFFGGLRNHEIARTLELDERTIASHLCRALDDLNQMYTDELRPTVARIRGVPNHERA